MSARMLALGVIVRWVFQRRNSTEAKARARLAAPKESPEPPERVQSRHRVDKRTIGGFTCYTVSPLDRTADSTVIYLHGGSFVREITASHWALVSKMVDAGLEVEVPIYGLTPQHNYREAYGFLDAVYRQVLQHRHVSRVAVVGDSSGGGLALGFVQTLPDRKLPVPDRLVLIAPWLDLTLSNPEGAQIRDPWLTRVGLLTAGKSWADGDDPNTAQLSPLNGSLSALPPTDIYVGSRDMFYPDVMTLRRRARGQCANLSITVCHGAIHVYPLLPTPEGRTAASAIVADLAEAGRR